MAHAFKHGDFVRVTLLLEKLPPRARRALRARRRWRSPRVAVGYLAFWAEPLHLRELGVQRHRAGHAAAADLDSAAELRARLDPAAASRCSTSWSSCCAAARPSYVRRGRGAPRARRLLRGRLRPTRHGHPRRRRHPAASLMLLLLAGGVWIAMTLAISAGSARPSSPPRSRARTCSRRSGRSNASWELAALPLFIWMGEILFRTRLSEQMFEGLAPWLNRVPGRLMHTTILGCGIFGSVSGSSAATCATIAKVALPELLRRGYDEKHRARLARHRRHARHPDPAVDHDGGLRGRGRRLDHPHLPRRLPARASC